MSSSQVLTQLIELCLLRTGIQHQNIHAFNLDEIDSMNKMSNKNIHIRKGDMRGEGQTLMSLPDSGIPTIRVNYLGTKTSLELPGSLSQDFKNACPTLNM